MYRTFSIIVIIFALFGGGFAGYEMYKSYYVGESPVNLDSAKGYAAAFARAFLTVENGKPAAIEMYTDLADLRNIEFKEIAITLDDRNKLNQRVIGIWPGEAEVLAGNHMNVKLTALVQREVPNKQKIEQDKNQLITYQLDIPVTQGEKGYRILQYPKMNKVEKDATASIPSLGSSDSQGEMAMKPMLVSFFKTYFEGQKQDDIANFFMNTATVPSPQQGLFLFENMNSIQAYPGQENHWFVFVDIRVKDPYTQVSYPFSYSMNIKKDNDKFYILSINE